MQVSRKKIFKRVISSESGISLLETIVGITLITISMGALISLYVQSLGLQTVIRDRYIGTFLAIEGIETIKNLADNNAVASGCLGGSVCDVDLMSSSPNDLQAVASNNLTGYFDFDGTLYVETPTGRFHREVTAAEDAFGELSPPNAGILVTSKVTWSGRAGVQGSVNLVERIYATNFHEF